MWQKTLSFLIIYAFFLPLTYTISTNFNSSEFVKQSALETTDNQQARQARIMHLVKERRPPVMKLKSRPVPYTHTKKLSRNDHYPLRHMPISMSGNNKRYPIMRRVQANGPYVYEPAKNTRYHSLKTAPTFVGKPSMHREFATNPHPNPHSHPHPNALSQNFKASPHFSGQAIVRPMYEFLTEAQKPQTDTFANLPVQQYPLPQETPQRPVALNYLNQQEKYIAPSSNFYEQQQQQQQRQQQQQQQYAVYEEPEKTADHVTTVKFANAADAKEALEFIQFMGSDAYFLPKHEPDYRVLDEQRDRQQYQQQLQQHYNLQQIEQAKYQNSAAENPPHISQLIYSEPNLPRSPHHIVKGSYQAGKNLFVVNSDGNKAVKHIVSSTPHTLPSALESTRYTPALRRRTPEPVRFEFTEQDAVVNAFTSDPSKRLRFVSSTARPLTTNSGFSYGGNSGYQHRNIADDPIDDDDIQHLHSEILGRVPLSSTTTQAGVSPTPPSEQKDTEDYCERMCANVQEDDEEIVCGSDGYMYTSESQMECYASCLHLDVTITGKGSCTAR